MNQRAPLEELRRIGSSLVSMTRPPADASGTVRSPDLADRITEQRRVDLGRAGTSPVAAAGSSHAISPTDARLDQSLPAPNRPPSIMHTGITSIPPNNSDASKERIQWGGADPAA